MKKKQQQQVSIIWRMQANASTIEGNGQNRLR